MIELAILEDECLELMKEARSARLFQTCFWYKTMKIVEEKTEIEIHSKFTHFVSIITYGVLSIKFSIPLNILKVLQTLI